MNLDLDFFIRIPSLDLDVSSRDVFLQAVEAGDGVPGPPGRAAALFVW